MYTGMTGRGDCNPGFYFFCLFSIIKQYVCKTCFLVITFVFAIYLFIYFVFIISFTIVQKWVVPENIRSPTMVGILEVQMQGGFLWPGISNA